MSETPLQQRVQPWMVECFGPTISADKQERNHRFLQEALELVQSCGATQSEAHQLVDYVYGRPVGKPFQEVGGVMITLAALCLTNDLDMHEAGEVELARIWTKVEQIRAKQAAKPKHSPLPAAAPVVFAIDEKQPISIDRQAASIDIQAAQLAAPVAEPVEYQHRMRPTWRDEGEGWTEGRNVLLVLTTITSRHRCCTIGSMRHANCMPHLLHRSQRRPNTSQKHGRFSPFPLAATGELIQEAKE